jgi:hypothetical protein
MFKLAVCFTLNGSIVTMDRGYTDYALFGRWTLGLLRYPHERQCRLRRQG